MISKFMRIIAIFTMIMAILSCSNNKTRSLTYDSNKISIDSSVEENKSFESYEYLKQNYLKGYNTIIEIDTTFYCEKRQTEIHLILKHKCLLDKSVKIPLKYNWGEKKTDWVTHNFNSEIILFEKEKVVFEKTITKEDFINFLDEPLIGCDSNLMCINNYKIQ